MDTSLAKSIINAPQIDPLSVVFSTPALEPWVCLEYKKSMCQTVALLLQHGISHGFLDRSGDAYLAKVRNKLASEFLESFPTAQNFFFIDADVGWPAEKVLEFIQRPEPVLAGIYPKKSDDVDFPVEMLVDVDTGQLMERNGLFRAAGIPTGFLRIKRHVLEQMASVSRKFRDMEPGGKERWYYNIFETGVGHDGWFWGEDYCMARKWIDAGNEIWVDPNIEFTHRGTKKWCRTLADHLDMFRDRGREIAENARAEADMAAAPDERDQSPTQGAA